MRRGLFQRWEILLLFLGWGKHGLGVPGEGDEVVLEPTEKKVTIQGGKTSAPPSGKAIPCLQLDPVLLAKRWTVFPGDEASAIPAELETEGEENNHETPFSSSNQADPGSGGKNPTLGPRWWEGAGAQEGEGEGDAAGVSRMGTTVSLSSVTAPGGR